MIRDERGVFEMSLINEFRNSETGDRFADTASLVKCVSVLRTCRAKSSSQHGISDITLARGLLSTVILLALPLRGCQRTRRDHMRCHFVL